MRTALALFAAARAYILSRSEVFTSFDSAGYHPISLTGHAPRPWGVPAFYSLFSADLWRVIGQAALGAAAWILLASVLWSAVRTPAARWLLLLGTLGLGLTTPVTGWDSAILSESLSISLGVLSLALLVRWAVTRNARYLAFAVPAMVWWMFTRTDVIVMVGIAMLAIVGFGRFDRRVWIAAAALAAGMGWSLAIAPATSQAFTTWSATGFSLAEETFLYRLRLEILPQPEVKAHFESGLGMPRCPGAEVVAAGTAWEIERFADEYRRCPELQAWAKDNRARSGYWMAFHHTDGYARSLTRIVPSMLSGPGYGAAYARPVPVLPGVVERAVFQPRAVVVFVLYGALLVVPVVMVFLRAWSVGWPLVVAGGVLAVACTVSVLFTLTLSAGEYSRLGIQEAVLLRLALLVLVAVVVERVASGRAPVPAG